MNIAIFYHIFQINHWEKLYTQQILSLQQSGVYDAANYIHIGINGSLPLPFDLMKVNKTNRNVHIDIGEADTLRDLHNFCKEHTDYKVLYLNMLGVSFPENFQNKISWTQYLTHFNVNNWQRCVQLLDNYDCVGTEWTTKHPSLGTDISPHYAGNFWWANSSYINRLDLNYLYGNKPYGFDDWKGQRRHLSEFWIGTGSPNHYNFYSSNKNKYIELVNPSEYEHI